MKNFEDLSHEEKANLTEDEVNYYIDLECAERGIALLPPGGPPIKPDKGMTADDLVLFEAGGQYFTDPADAGAVCATLNACKSRVVLNYISGPSYRKYAEPATDPVTSGQSTALSQELRAKLSSLIEEQERAADEYKKAQQAYDSIVSKRRDVVDEIRGAIATSRRNMARKSELATKFSRYIELAGGDKLVAARFIRQAEPDVADYLPELREDQEYRLTVTSEGEEL